MRGAEFNASITSKRDGDCRMHYHRSMHLGFGLLFPTLLTTCLLQAGCHGHLNQQNGLYGGNQALPALENNPSATPLAGRPEGEVVPLDRREWTIQVLEIDQAQVEHTPSYGSAQPVISSLGSSSLVWPNRSTALDTDANDGAEALNAALAPLVAAGNILIFPVRGILTPPWVVVLGAPEAETIELLPEERTPLPWNWVERPVNTNDDEEVNDE